MAYSFAHWPYILIVFTKIKTYMNMKIATTSSTLLLKAVTLAREWLFTTPHVLWRPATEDKTHKTVMYIVLEIYSIIIL